MQHTALCGILPGEEMKFAKDNRRNKLRKLHPERQYTRRSSLGEKPIPLRQTKRTPQRSATLRDIRLWRRFFAPPLVSEVSLRFGHARGKTTLSCFLTLSRRFATPMAYAQMRTLRRSSLGEKPIPLPQTKRTPQRSPFVWRRGRDSNPRVLLAQTDFESAPL